VTLISTLESDWLGRLYSRDIFHVEGFPLQRLQIDELFIVIGLLYVFRTCNVINFFINFTFFSCNVLFSGMIEPICAESAIKPQSVNLLTYLFTNSLWQSHCESSLRSSEWKSINTRWPLTCRPSCKLDLLVHLWAAIGRIFTHSIACVWNCESAVKRQSVKQSVCLVFRCGESRGGILRPCEQSGALHWLRGTVGRQHLEADLRPELLQVGVSPAVGSHC